MLHCLCVILDVQLVFWVSLRNKELFHELFQETRNLSMDPGTFQDMRNLFKGHRNCSGTQKSSSGSITLLSNLRTLLVCFRNLSGNPKTFSGTLRKPITETSFFFFYNLINLSMNTGSYFFNQEPFSQELRKLFRSKRNFSGTQKPFL